MVVDKKEKKSVVVDVAIPSDSNILGERGAVKKVGSKGIIAAPSDKNRDCDPKLGELLQQIIGTKS